MDDHTFLAPDRKTLKRGFYISLAYLLATLVSGTYSAFFFVLAPFALYHIAYARRALQPRALGLELRPDCILVCAPFSKTLRVMKQDIGVFLQVYYARTEVIVARSFKDSDDDFRAGSHYRKGDIILPRDIMPLPQLLAQLEAWRTAP